MIYLSNISSNEISIFSLTFYEDKIPYRINEPKYMKNHILIVFLVHTLTISQALYLSVFPRINMHN